MGGRLVAGRWHSRGRPIVYMADSSALAMLEVLVHLEVEAIPPCFQLMRIEGPDALAFTEPAAADLIGPDTMRSWGDAWLAAGRTALARVPSRIAPHGFNWLLNPEHRAAAALQVTATGRWPWDERLFRR